MLKVNVTRVKVCLILNWPFGWSFYTLYHFLFKTGLPLVLALIFQIFVVYKKSLFLQSFKEEDKQYADLKRNLRESIRDMRRTVCRNLNMTLN